MALTKKVIAISNMNDDAVLDIIPLHEITAIQDMTLIKELEEDDASDAGGSAAGDDGGSTDLNDSGKNTLQIETSQVGYNSGRVYQIRAASVENFSPMLEKMLKLSTIAREEAEKKSKFRKSQDRVGNVFNSDTVQRILALMIFGVSCRDTSHAVKQDPVPTTR